MSPSKAAVEHPVLTLIVFSLLGIMGIFTLSNVAIDLFPDTDIPMIVVMTEYENAGPESLPDWAQVLPDPEGCLRPCLPGIPWKTGLPEPYVHPAARH